MATKQLTDDNFQSEIDTSSVPVLVDFWAEWCGPCKQIGPILEEISSDYEGKLSVVKVNIDENPLRPQTMELEVYQLYYYLKMQS